MKTKKRRFEGFLFYDYIRIAEHLEKMAQKGWMLSKINRYSWEYRRIEPARLRFAVTYFPQASDLNPVPTDQQEEFWAYCETAGWKLAAEWDQMQIMYTEQEAQVPLETDEEVKLEIIHRSMKKNFLPGSMFILCVTLLRLLDWSPAAIGWYLNDIALSFFSGLIWFSLYQIAVLAAYAVWYYRSIRSVKNGGRCAEPKSPRVLNGILIGMTFVSLGWMLLLLISENVQICLLVSGAIALLMAGVTGASRLLKNLGLSPRANFATVLIVGSIAGALMMTGISSWIAGHREALFPEDKPASAEELLLTIEDVREPEYEAAVFETEQKESMFLKWTRGSQRAATNAGAYSWLEYQIYEVKMVGLYDYFLELIVDEASPGAGSGWRTINIRNPEAGSIYRCSYVLGASVPEQDIEVYVIRTGDRIIRLKLGWDATEEELDLAMRALGIIK